jgi:hypothetical protein
MTDPQSELDVERAARLKEYATTNAPALTAEARRLRDAESSSELDLEGIRARVEAATPGPWEADEGKVTCDHSADPSWALRERPVVTTLASDTDAEFIAHARTDVPALLDALEKVDRIATMVNGQYLEQLARAQAAEARLVEVEEALRELLVMSEVTEHRLLDDVVLGNRWVAACDAARALLPTRMTREQEQHVYNGWPHGNEPTCSCGWNPTREQRDEPRAMRTQWEEHAAPTREQE